MGSCQLFEQGERPALKKPKIAALFAALVRTPCFSPCFFWVFHPCRGCLTLEPDGEATGCNPVKVGSTPTGVFFRPAAYFVRGSLSLFGNFSGKPGTPSAPTGTVTVEPVNASPIGS